MAERSTAACLALLPLDLWSSGNNNESKPPANATVNYTCTRCRSCPGGRVFLGARCHFVCRFQTRAREMLLQPVSTDRAMDAMSRELYTLPARNGRHTHVGAGIGEGCNPPCVLEAVVQP